MLPLVLLLLFACRFLRFTGPNPSESELVVHTMFLDFLTTFTMLALLHNHPQIVDKIESFCGVSKYKDIPPISPFGCP